MSPRRRGSFDLIASPAYIVMSASDRFQNPTKRVNEIWQTDFTYFKIVGWGWYYLATVLDDFSRYIIAWKLFKTMATEDVKVVLDLAVAATGVDQVKVKHRPRLLSDNGPCYVSDELRKYLADKGMDHTRGAPYHPQTQGKACPRESGGRTLSSLDEERRSSSALLPAAGT